jgi:hypothetical protein
MLLLECFLLLNIHPIHNYGILDHKEAFLLWGIIKKMKYTEEFHRVVNSSNQNGRDDNKIHTVISWNLNASYRSETVVLFHDEIEDLSRADSSCIAKGEECGNDSKDGVMQYSNSKLCKMDHRFQSCWSDRHELVHC